MRPISFWKDGKIENITNGKFRDELHNGEFFYPLKEAHVLIERWRLEYNTFRPHSSLDIRPPVQEA
jgi:putative transposase